MQQNTTTKQVSEEMTYIGSSNSSSGIPISFGYLAQAQAALLLMQENYTELDQLQRKTNILELKNQQGPGGTIMAQAKAIQNSADADQDKAMKDMYSEITQAGGSFLNAAIEGTNKLVGNKGYEEADGERKDATNFGKAFEDSPKAAQVVSDDANGGLNPDQIARKEKILASEGSVKLEKGDEKILEHIKANDEDRKMVSKRINQAKTDAVTAMQTAQSNRQQLIQLFTGLSTAGQHAGAAAFAAQKGTIDAEQKGPADALRVVAQASDGTTSSAIQNGEQLAAKVEDQIAALNRIRDALASNNGTAGG